MHRFFVVFGLFKDEVAKKILRPTILGKAPPDHTKWLLGGLSSSSMRYRT